MTGIGSIEREREEFLVSKAEPSPTSPSTAVPRVILVAAALSGFACLGYETAWLRRLTHLWGSSGVAVAIVAMIFMFGLGVGTWLYPLIMRRARGLGPVRVYVVLELLVALFAAAMPWCIRAIDAVANSGPIAKELEGSAHWWLVAGSSLLLLSPATILMGSCLPAAVAAVSSRELTDGTEGVSPASSGAIYGWNTIGAALGCLIAGFVFLPLWGVTATSFVLVSANVAAAALAATLRTNSRGQRPAARQPVSGRGRRGVLVAAAAASFVGMTLEVVWFRQAALVLGGSGLCGQQGRARSLQLVRDQRPGEPAPPTVRIVQRSA